MKLPKHSLDFGRVIAYYPSLRKITGSVNSSILLCQFIYWSDKSDDNGWVYKDSLEIEEETGLTYHEQKTARERLIEAGLLLEEPKKLSHKINYKINQEELDKQWEKIGGKRKVKSAPKTPKVKEKTAEELKAEEDIKKAKEEEAKIAAAKILEEVTIAGIREVSVKSSSNSPLVRNIEKRGDLVDGTLAALDSPGMKREEVKKKIKATLERKLQINATGRRWEEFIKFAYTRQEKFGEYVDVFIDYALAKGFDPIYWTPEKMEILYPQAFAEDRRNKPDPNFVEKLPELEEENYAPMPESVRKRRSLF